jgi:hypothetical protein
MFLVPPSTCNSIKNDGKASSFNLLSWFCSRTKSSSIYENSICFQISIKNFTSCFLATVIDVALSIGARHANIRWKAEKDIYVFGIQSFGSFHFKPWSKFQIASSLQSVQYRIPAAFVNFNKAYLLNHLLFEGTRIPVGNQRNSSIPFLFDSWSEIQPQ